MAAAPPVPSGQGLPGAQHPPGTDRCVLTWYDPALGGTNSASGQPNPNSPTASGDPYNPNKDTCAAPSEFPFGELIRFNWHGKSVTCKVNDRGGAITDTAHGPHFDLSRHAAQTLGIIQSGMVTDATYTVEGAGSGGPLDLVTGPINAIGGAIGSVGDVFSFIGKAIAFIFSLQFLYVIAGAGIIVVGLFLLYRKV